MSTKYKALSPQEELIIVHKETEAPFSGIYDAHFEQGVYLCKRCEVPLYCSEDKFNAQCGWPAFDDEISGAVVRQQDKDGLRTELICASCGAHLGHIFEGEYLTNKNIRHCVNSLSLLFKPKTMNQKETKLAIFAGGCFWGMEYHFAKQVGVLACESGYSGGTTENPSYEEVCAHLGHHAEVIQVTYDPALVTFEQLCKLFFEIHDPTQVGGQGPDMGEQYRSEIFYTDDEQKMICLKLIATLQSKGLEVVTQLTPFTKFWKAEEYHQAYYATKGTRPYCHAYTKRF